jgi:trypsin-like peptidase
MISSGRRKVCLVVIVCLSMLLSFAQVKDASRPPSPEPNKSAAATVQPIPTAALLKRVVAFLTLDCRDGSVAEEVRGTAFFVFYPDSRIGENRGFIYLVTNRHVAQPELNGHRLAIQKVSLRLNLKVPVEGRESEDGAIPVGSGVEWFFPSDEAVDLAAMSIAPDQTKYDYEPFPVSLFATKEVAKERNVAEGDAVLFSGFFYQFPSQRKIEPIVRQGILAMMPEEDLTTTLGGLGRLYLADVHVFHGNSGAPMFVNVGGVRGGSLIVGGFPYLLLGVVSGYFLRDRGPTAAGRNNFDRQSQRKQRDIYSSACGRTEKAPRFTSGSISAGRRGRQSAQIGPRSKCEFLRGCPHASHALRSAGFRGAIPLGILLIRQQSLPYP